MPCPFCGGYTLLRTVDHPFVEARLPHVVLRGVTRVDCEDCDELDGVVIPRLESLQALIDVADTASGETLVFELRSEEWHLVE